MKLLHQLKSDYLDLYSYESPSIFQLVMSDFSCATINAVLELFNLEIIHEYIQRVNNLLKKFIFIIIIEYAVTQAISSKLDSCN